MSSAEHGIVIPEEVVEAARQTIGAFFSPIAKADPEENIRDFLDTSKSFKRAGILERYTVLRAQKVLEIGSGFGTNLAIWIKHYDVDGYGVEPGSAGFDAGYLGSKKLFAANRIDPERVLNATGEALPFPDESFSIVYSANVLEHTENPEAVLAEALRVLRPGGLLHMEMPNFLSYFEGHYLILQPPLVSEHMLPWLVRWIYHRDPAFAKTLNTRINPVWCRRNLVKLQARYPLELLSLGEDVFLERLVDPFQFEMKLVAGKLALVMNAVQALNVRNWIGKTIVALQGHYPIYLTVRKSLVSKAR